MMNKKIIGIIHNEPVPSGHAFSEASLDVLVQVEAIEKALKGLGSPCTRIPFTKDVSAFFQKMKEEQVAAAFNLCESVDEDPQYIGHPAAMLEIMGIPFSGSPSMAIMLTTDKLLTKHVLKAAGIGTPNYRAYEGVAPDFAGMRFPVIVKPRFQDASIGIDQESVFEQEDVLRGELDELYGRFGSLLVEEFVGGREFNVSLLGYPSAQPLPVAEIVFNGFPDDLAPIVGYKAKWDTSSFEYRHTVREFPKNLPSSLEAELGRTARACFNLFTLRDYGRVDMRIDDSEAIQVLEINANPCLSPDAGFAAAIEEKGMNYSQMVEHLRDFLTQRFSYI